MKKGLILVFIMLYIFNFVSLVWADEQIEEVDSTFYITEETTAGDLVRNTNPDYDEIPDEVKERLDEIQVQSENTRGYSIGLYVPKDFFENIIKIGIVFIVICVVLVLKRRIKK